MVTGLLIINPESTTDFITWDQCIKIQLVKLVKPSYFFLNSYNAGPATCTCTIYCPIG